MNINIIKITDWDLVYRQALYTQGKQPKKQFPSNNWKEKTCIAQHSPLRCLQFVVDIEGVPNFVHNHLVRHIHLQPFIRTMRSDLTGIPSSEITRLTPNNGSYLINAQEMINVSRLRLCNKASKETRETWEVVINELKKIEPELASMCVPNCVEKGYCPEYKDCGYVDTEKYCLDRAVYLSKARR